MERNVVFNLESRELASKFVYSRGRNIRAGKNDIEANRDAVGTILEQQKRKQIIILFLIRPPSFLLMLPRLRWKDPQKISTHKNDIINYIF